MCDYARQVKPLLYSTSERDEIDLNQRFERACENGDMQSLDELSQIKEQLSDEVISENTCLVLMDDKLDLFKYLFENFTLSLNKENLLATSVLTDSIKCFKYLTLDQKISVDSLKYTNVYEKALNMYNELSKNRPSCTMMRGNSVFI